MVNSHCFDPAGPGPSSPRIGPKQEEASQREAEGMLQDEMVRGACLERLVPGQQ